MTNVAPSTAASDPFPPVVLLVGPHPGSLRALSDCFGASGFFVARPTGVSEAFDVAAELTPDLVVIAETTETAVFELVERLKTAEATHQIPLIMVSERARRTIPRRARQHCDRCFETSIPPADLVDAATGLIRKSRGRRRERTDATDNRRAETGKKPVAALRRHGLEKHRRCPACDTELEWVERARLYGVEYDYYRWCSNGCGLYCYERLGETWVKLI